MSNHQSDKSEQAMCPQGEATLETQTAEVCRAGHGPLNLEQIEALRALFRLLDRWDREDTNHGE